MSKHDKSKEKMSGKAYNAELGLTPNSSRCRNG